MIWHCCAFSSKEKLHGNTRSVLAMSRRYISCISALVARGTVSSECMDEVRSLPTKIEAECGDSQGWATNKGCVYVICMIYLYIVCMAPHISVMERSIYV